MVKRITVKLDTLRQHPDNPRDIKDYRLEELTDSLKDFPEMLEARPIVINANNEIIGGNQRFKALQELRIDEVEVYATDWDKKRQKQFMLKDNVGSGEWDYSELMNAWDSDELSKWSMDYFKYTPSLQPVQDKKSYTEEDIEKIKETLDSKFSQTEKDYQAIKCEECGEMFYVDK